MHISKLFVTFIQTHLIEFSSVSVHIVMAHVSGREALQLSAPITRPPEIYCITRHHSNIHNLNL